MDKIILTPHHEPNRGQERLLPMNLAPVKPWESARGLAQSKTLTRCVQGPSTTL